MADELNTVVETVENFFNPNATYPDQTLPPSDCHDSMDKEVQVFWDLVYSMAGVLMITILMPYIFFCCKNWPRVLAKLYGLAGMLNAIVGVLMLSVLLPQCPLDCGEFFCSVHKYNPGPIYGCFCLFLALLWWCKACSLRRQAKQQEIEKQAEKAEGAAGAKDATGEVV